MVSSVVHCRAAQSVGRAQVPSPVLQQQGQRDRADGQREQVDKPDLVALAVSAAPLGLLLKDRAWYLRPNNAAGGATMDNRADHRQDPP